MCTYKDYLNLKVCPNIEESVSYLLKDHIDSFIIVATQLDECNELNSRDEKIKTNVTKEEKQVFKSSLVASLFEDEEDEDTDSVEYDGCEFVDDEQEVGETERGILDDYDNKENTDDIIKSLFEDEDSEEENRQEEDNCEDESTINDLFEDDGEENNDEEDNIEENNVIDDLFEDDEGDNEESINSILENNEEDINDLFGDEEESTNSILENNEEDGINDLFEDEEEVQGNNDTYDNEEDNIDEMFEDEIENEQDKQYSDEEDIDSLFDEESNEDNELEFNGNGKKDRKALNNSSKGSMGSYTNDKYSDSDYDFLDSFYGTSDEGGEYEKENDNTDVRMGTYTKGRLSVEDYDFKLAEEMKNISERVLNYGVSTIKGLFNRKDGKK